MRAADQAGCYQHFEFASIFWKPSTGAHVLRDGIRAHWAALGWEASPGLGYPISGQQSRGVDCFAEFEHGVLYARADSAEICKLPAH
jgi:uncharacterized protein with LGFP repeats